MLGAIRSRFRSNASIAYTQGLLARGCTRELSTNIGRLQGKVALITGAANGIGKETTAKFIYNGAKVVIADINQNVGQETAAALGENASFIRCDVTKESDISNAVDFTISKHGQLDIMYNNAGIACRTPPSMVDLDLTSFDRVMEINVRGVVAGIKHASRVMIPRSKGCILCTASVTGVMAGLAQLVYSVSKASVIATVKCAAAALSNHGIRVNAISPHAIPTALVMEEMRQHFPNLDDQQIEKMVRDTVPLKGAYCEVTDVANAAVYLASDEAKFVNGHNLVVDGGFTSFKTLNFAYPN